MNADAMRDMLRRQPFEPFEIVMASGEKYPVTHPETLLVLRSQAVVGNPDTERVSFLSLPLVTELRPILPQPSASNGDSR